MRKIRSSYFWGIFLLSLPAVSACKTSHDATGGSGTGSSAVATAAAPDMALKELCPAKPPPDGDVAGEVKRAPEEIAKIKDTSAKIMALSEDRTRIAAALDKICDKITSDFAEGKPFPTEPVKIDGTYSIAFGGRTHAKDGDIEALYACRAMLTDSDGPCDLIKDGEQKSDCRERRELFHDAKKAPKSTAWRVSESFIAMCKKRGGGDKCDAYAAALRGGDPSKCPNAEGMERCAALATGDPSKCPKGDPWCASRTKRYQLINEGGLAKLAAEGSGPDKIEASAALGKKEACAPFMQAVKLSCASLESVTPTLFPPALMKEAAASRPAGQGSPDGGTSARDGTRMGTGGAKYVPDSPHPPAQTPGQGPGPNGQRQPDDQNAPKPGPAAH